MRSIETLEQNRRKWVQDNYYLFLCLEKFLVEKSFDWLNCKIDGKVLSVKGSIKPPGSKSLYEVSINFSPFYKTRFERVHILSPDIPFNPKIHMYYDKSLCLYYPNDHSPFINLHLTQMIPWISEWITKYEFWKKYRVWLGDEVKH
jgi:hypothetical protein